MAGHEQRGPREPLPKLVDPLGGPDEEDPELSAIEESLDQGLIYIEDYRWMDPDEAEEEFGAERVAEMVAQQEIELRAYLRRRRGEPEPDDG